MNGKRGLRGNWNLGRAFKFLLCKHFFSDQQPAMQESNFYDNRSRNCRQLITTFNKSSPYESRLQPIPSGYRSRKNSNSEITQSTGPTFYKPKKQEASENQTKKSASNPGNILEFSLKFQQKALIDPLRNELNKIKVEEIFLKTSCLGIDTPKMVRIVYCHCAH